MGDTGSLSLGGSLGAVGIITKHEIVLAITGGLFVFEAISVIVQVISFKVTGKGFLRWLLFIIITKRKDGRVYCCNKILDSCNYFSDDWFGNIKI